MIQVLLLYSAFALGSNEAQNNATSHLRHQALVARDVKLAAAAETDLTHVKSDLSSNHSTRHWSSSGTPSERRAKRSITLSYLIPHQDSSKEIAGPADTGRDVENAKSHSAYVKQFVGILCCVFTAGAYIIGFSLLIWWHLHPGRRGEGKATCEIIQEDAEATSRSSRSRQVSRQVSNVNQEDDEAAPIASSPSKMRLLSRSGTKFHDEAPHDLVEIEGDDLIDTTGISGMCVLPPCQMGGITGVPDRLAVPILFVQAVGLQALLLFNILPRLSPNMDDSHSSPNVLVFVAIYLHFLNCVQDLPYGIQIFYYFTDLHTELRDVLWFGVVLLADAFVIPSICFILGAFFICTSRTVIDVIMNALQFRL
jgi:hypothetical protein